MIYIIDDSNIESMNASFLLDKKYENIICLITSVERLEMERPKLFTAECIMVHRTFCNSNLTTAEMETLTDNGNRIPFVVFSAGDSENAVFNDNAPWEIKGIKKSVFYSRLRFFLESYLSKHTIDLRLLAFGRDYQKITVRKLALAVLKIIAGKEGKMGLYDIAAIAACKEFKLLIDMSNPQLGIDYNSLLENLEDHPIDFCQFSQNIQRITNSFNQYGKNIYTWQ